MQQAIAGGLVLVLVLVIAAEAQTLAGIYTQTPQNIALVSANATVAVGNTSPFQIYDESFTSILGSEPTVSLAYEAAFPAFHEGGIVTSLDPLTIYSSSNQFNTTFASASTNNKTIVVSRTQQDSNTGSFELEIVSNDTAPLRLANGGFQYRDGILWASQGTTAQTYSAGLVYLPISSTVSNETTATTILNNYIGNPLNSPNDVYVSKSGVIYFTDPFIGYAQNIRPRPQLPANVYGFIPNTTQIRAVADGFQSPNGVQLSPDEKTAYVTDTGAAVILGTNSTSAFRTIYAYDAVYRAPKHGQIYGESQPAIAQFTNRRVFATTSKGIPDGIKCDDQGNVWVGSGDGIDVYNSDGVLLGKILVEGGCSNFGFASDGRIFALGEEKLWLIQVDRTVNPAVRVGERRG